MLQHEQEFFKLQREVVSVKRVEHGFLCSACDIQAPDRVKARGNVDIQMHEGLPAQFKLTKESVVVDIGGYIGDTAYALSKAGCRVYTFEPFLENYLSLLFNLRETNVTSYLVALGNGEKVSFNRDYESSDCGMLYVVEDPNGVPTMKLDELLPWPRLDFIKIDCEGREISVLQGAAQTIAKYRPPMFIESFPDGLKRQGVTPKDLHEQILSMGYTVDCQTTDYTTVRDLVCYPQ